MVPVIDLYSTDLCLTDDYLFETCYDHVPYVERSVLVVSEGGMSLVLVSTQKQWSSNYLPVHN